MHAANDELFREAGVLGGVETFQVITGDDTANSLTGSSHDDIIRGLGGDDTLISGGGADKIFGGDGDDSIEGGNGTGTLKGGAGDDTISAGTSSLVLGGSGNDHIVDVRSLSATVHGGAGDDAIFAVAGSAGVSAGSINGDSGDDYVLINFNTKGTWRVFGGKGDDTLSTQGSDGSFFDGGTGRDTIFGGNADDTIHGGAGADLLMGGGGHNAVFGDDGNDALRAFGDTTFDGGAGQDTIDFFYASGPAFIDLAAGSGRSGHGIGATTFSSVENATGGAGDDLIQGDDGANVLAGGAGNDTLDGRDGNDRLSGGTFADTLIGGLGGDTLDGGESADTFQYGAIEDSTTANPDLILKLQAGDSIDLSAIDADTTVEGDQAFTLVSGFTGHAGELTIAYDAGSGLTRIEGDVDGDGTADFEIDARHDHAGFSHFVL